VETQLARGRQTQIKNAFRNWVFADPERRHVLVERYNALFNAMRIREYDGSRLQLPGLSRAFEPYAHQRNAVARKRLFEYLEDITRGTLRQAQLNAELNLENQEAEVLPEGTGQAAQPGECSSEGSRDVEMLKDLEEVDIHLEEGM